MNPPATKSATASVVSSDKESENEKVPESNGEAATELSAVDVRHFKHKDIARFRIRRKNGSIFEFQNGMLTILATEYEEFMGMLAAMERRHQAAIVEVQNIRNERNALDDYQTIRGATATNQIRDKVAKN